VHRHQNGAQAARTADFAECLVPRGGVLAMRPLAIHASSKSIGNESRRVLHLEYSAVRRLGDGLELAVT
jgi:hypothetical protein